MIGGASSGMILQKQAERRLAAIMVADIVGYSRMMGADEAGTLRRLKALRRELIDPQIAAARGRIVKTMGDGLLVEFPSPVRAVTCAVRIQQAMPGREQDLSPENHFRLRFGINVGDVMAEPDGDLYGDGVNVAARLEPQAEPGGLCVSRSVHDQVRDKLPYRFEDRGKLELKNIARPIGVFALTAETIRSLPEASEQEDTETHAHSNDKGALQHSSISDLSRKIRFARWGIAGVVAITLCTISAFWLRQEYQLPRSGSTLAVQNGLPPAQLPALSLVVLPFENLGKDPEQEFFADGLTEDLTTDLSHLAGSFVIARNTAFTYKGKAIDVKQIGRELGVRYVLEGSVRRQNNHITLNAQLVSTETGGQIWSDRLDGERDQLGELQADFVARLARSLDVQLIQAESLRSLRERPNNPTASDLTMRGWAALNRPRSLANANEAIKHFEEALANDPNNEQSQVGLAQALMIKVSGGISEDSKTDTARAEEILSTILSRNSENALAHVIKGFVYRARKQFSDAILEDDLAIGLNKNLAMAYHQAGVNRMFDGQSASSLAYFDQAIRLSPKDPQLNSFEYNICHSHAHLGEWEKAIKWCRQSVAHGPFWLAFIDLAASYAWTGQGKAAKEAVEQVLKLKPGYTVQKWAHADWSRNPTFLNEYQRLVTGLRMAGLPEGETN